MRNPLGERAGVRLQDLDRAIGDLAGREFLDAACGPFVVSLPPNPFPWESEPGAKPSLAKRLESLQANAPRLGKLTVHAIGAAVLAQDLDPRSGLDVGRPGGVASLQLPGARSRSDTRA